YGFHFPAGLGTLPTLGYITRGAPGYRGYMQSAKRACLEISTMKIGTHSGSFHCDEVLACYFLKQLPQYQDAEIVRTRDPVVLEQCDIVVDVGGVFDPKKHRYDHHQRSFVETFNSLCPEKPWVTKLSSAGLVYVHFGRQVLSHLTHLQEDSRELGILYDKMYENFVEEVDAVDNGISQCDGEARYTVTTSLSARVGYLNPRWNSSLEASDIFSSNLCLSAVAKKTIKNIIMMKMALIRTSLGKEEQVFPLLYRISTSELSLLEEWRGVRDDALSELSGISSCIFVHSSGFIGGNKTKEGALEMARRTLQAGPNPGNASNGC
uniref:Chromosome 12 open reading frame 10 n=1 Tax=Astyanax mexicanus TaxID=7994 RepID=A0A8B9GSC0_ASTMX